MAVALFSYVLTVAAVITAGIRAARMRKASNRPAAIALIVMLLALACTFGLKSPPSQAWINRIVPDLFKLIGDSTTLTAMTAASALVLHTRHAPEHAWSAIRWRSVVLAAAVVVLVVMFFLPHPIVLTGSFDLGYAVDPTLSVYTITYAGYLGGTLIDLTIQFARFAAASSAWMRAGLVFLCVGSGVGVGHAVATIITVIYLTVTKTVQATGGADGVCTHITNLPCFVAVGSPAIAVAISIIGLLLCAAAAVLDNLARWRHQWRTYHRLVPLWRVLTAEFPEVQQPEGGSRARTVRQRVARRIIEIRDGLLLLAPYRDADLADHARAAAAATGHGAEPAVLEAIEIMLAMRRHARHEPPSAGPAPPPQRATTDLDAEVAWLEQVALALTRIPFTHPVGEAS